MPDPDDPMLEDRLISAYRVDRPPHSERPWVVANMVMGVDGGAADHGRVGSLTGPVDQALFTALRSMADAVLVGASTVRAERYGPVRLTGAERAVRAAAGRPEVPPLVVVSRSLRFDWSVGAFTTAGGGSPPIIVTTERAPADELVEARRHAEVLVAGEHGVEVGRMMAQLAERGIDLLLTEGGPTLLGELVAAGSLDELCLTVAPTVAGDPLPVMVLPPGARRPRLDLAHVREIDGHVFLRYTSEAPLGPQGDPDAPGRR